MCLTHAPRTEEACRLQQPWEPPQNSPPQQARPSGPGEPLSFAYLGPGAVVRGVRRYQACVCAGIGDYEFPATNHPTLLAQCEKLRLNAGQGTPGVPVLGSLATNVFSRPAHY